MACEWIGTKLAAWFGLPTFNVAIIQVESEDEIPLGHGRMAETGSAFVSRMERGHPWGGGVKELSLVHNIEQVNDLVVFDTWVLNCDRHPPDLKTRKPNRDNVFFSEEDAPDGMFTLKAIDHTHCFTCGRELNESATKIENVKDDRIYGLFPEFADHVEDGLVRKSLAKLAKLDSCFVRDLVYSIPVDWEVPRNVQDKIIELICDRADFVGGTMWRSMCAKCFPQAKLDLPGEEVD